jgi:hypothetical protein
MLSRRSSSETPTQPSKLLPLLFEHIDEDERLTVFHAGNALPETVDFFSNYRCKLHFIDLFSELPLATLEDSGLSLEQQFGEILQLPADTQFDLCLFWDVFNFLDTEAITAFLSQLRPCLKTTSLAHAFSVHNLKTPQGSQLYGIKHMDTLSLRNRQTKLPGYAPHSQSQLKQALTCFKFERSVLLPDSRLELVLGAHL